jgi:hypothetical protein
MVRVHQLKRLASLWHVHRHEGIAHGFALRLCLATVLVGDIATPHEQGPGEVLHQRRVLEGVTGISSAGVHRE